MPGSEIITVQLGSYANFVGSHFWNIQDEAIGLDLAEDWASVASTLNSEVVCAWSEDRHGESTYRPRTVLVDLSGSLGGVSFDRTSDSPSDAASASAQQHSSQWGGGIQVQQAPLIAKSKFRQQLEDAGVLFPDTDDVDQLDAQQQALEAAAAELHSEQQAPQYWTDFLQVDLEDSCVLTLSGVWQGQQGWDGWGVPGGGSSSAARELVDTAVDRVRWWAEQCDGMQGLQLFADDLGGWGGICHDVLQQLRDQYPSQPLLYFSLQQPQQDAASAAAGQGLSAAQIRRNLTSSMSLCEIPQLASLYVPLDAAGHHYTAASSTSSFNTAALLAAAIDTVTLPFRCTGSRSVVGEALGGTDLHSLVHLLSGPAANLAAACLQLPAGSIPPSSSSSSGSGPGAAAPQSATDAAPSSSSDSSSTAAWLSLGPAGVSGGGSSSSSSSLTPGVELTPQHCLAESVTLRGARTSPAAALCTTGQAKHALDALLLQRQRQAVGCRCVVHSCLSPMPLAAPLSFPALLLPPVSHMAAAPQGPATAPGAHASTAAGPRPFLPRSAKAPAVPAPSALSRLTASSGFEPLLQGAASGLQRLGAYSAGRACIEEWGYSGSDLLELKENLLSMAGRYSVDFD